MVKEWICQEEPLIRADGASVGVGFRQMVELVRCKDCKHFIKTANDAIGHCTKDISCWIFRNDDWFCADGERKETHG